MPVTLTHQHSLTRQENLKLNSASYSASDGKCETKAMLSPGGTGKLQQTVKNMGTSAGANSCEAAIDSHCRVLLLLLGCCSTDWRHQSRGALLGYPFPAVQPFQKFSATTSWPLPSTKRITLVALGSKIHRRLLKEFFKLNLPADRRQVLV